MKLSGFHVCMKKWGIPLDYIIVPSGITQEMLVLVLKRIVDTGESILVGYNKVFAK